MSNVSIEYINNLVFFSLERIQKFNTNSGHFILSHILAHCFLSENYLQMVFILWLTRLNLASNHVGCLKVSIFMSELYKLNAGGKMWLNTHVAKCVRFFLNIFVHVTIFLFHL